MVITSLTVSVNPLQSPKPKPHLHLYRRLSLVGVGARCPQDAAGRAAFTLVAKSHASVLGLLHHHQFGLFNKPLQGIVFGYVLGGSGAPWTRGTGYSRMMSRRHLPGSHWRCLRKKTTTTTLICVLSWEVISCKICSVTVLNCSTWQVYKTFNRVSHSGFVAMWSRVITNSRWLMLANFR